ncbi:U2 small nuclear ribonucleoprotein auxiliary factor 35 kDa subunit-related protein 2-like [Centruroides sculpturatus]|uniref:U2 small nuclear ribonucleoprotein auxiliary factor 35 kDa subunit-related protein 2-like n=1 Tax=Centruroides sculpturatus TaxID=218467 RepID=UPI000C6EB7AF|nr:U2 small nuclear ribonucleoprotein auxiliary factor 35 kDa subunit-related protein 2-like [Centruroides sculpturatus]
MDGRILFPAVTGFNVSGPMLTINFGVGIDQHITIFKKEYFFSHKKFRALLKKFRRKFKRQALAKLREQKAQNESSEDEIEESIKLEEEEKERERQHMLWLEREKEAQELFEKQKDLRELQKKREEEIKKIKDDLVLSQKEKEIKIDEKKEQKLKLLESLNQETSNTPWHNPIAPEDYNVQTKESCSFFLKTGCCRFGER